MKNGLLLLALLTLLLPVCLVGAMEEDSTSPQAVPISVEIEEYLVGLPPPRELLAVAPSLRNAPPHERLRTLAEQQAAPLLSDLRRLQSEGRVISFVLDPARFAIRVRARGDLASLKVANAYVAEAKAGPPACAAGLPEALAEAVRFADVNVDMDRVAPRVAADAPTINVNVRAPYIGEYSRVYGSAAPDSEVVMRVYRNGSLYLEWYNETNSNGNYTMYPYWEDCPRSGYVWYLQPGDVVEIESEGEKAQTTVVPLIASVDPIAGIIDGQTAPNRAIGGWVDMPLDDGCSYESEEWAGTSNTSGHFQVSVGTSISLDRRAFGSVYVYDANGNATFTYPDTFAVTLETGYNGVWFYAHRASSGTVRLTRNGQQIVQANFSTDATGFASVYFDDTSIVPGDVATVHDGLMTMSATLAPASFLLDAAQNRVQGMTTAGRRVQTYIYRRDDSGGPVQTGCDYSFSCGMTTAAGNGSAGITADFDVRPGDYAYVYLYDAQGNIQYTPSRSAPTLVAGANLYHVQGYWPEPYVEITVRLFDASNNLRAQTNTVTEYQGEFFAWLSQPAATGNRVEVSDGVTTRSMVVTSFAGRLDSTNDALTLGGPDRPYVATFENYDGYFYDTFECYEGSVVGGGRSIDLSGRVSPGDFANVYQLGTDGNYSVLELAAFKVYVDQGSTQLYVRTETPSAEIRLLHQRNGATLLLQTLAADSMGYAFFTSTSAFQAGDYIEIDGFGVEDTLGTEMILTPLTAMGNTARNAVYGVMAPSSQGIVWLSRRTPGYWWSTGYVVYSDGNGQYDVEFRSDSYWGGNWGQHCKNVLVSDRCVVPRIEYLTSSGHSVELSVSARPAAAADASEPDNTAATAKAHSGLVRTHTFHTTTDVDWVKVTVPVWAIGRPIYLRALNMGWGVQVNLDLYQADGITPVPYDSLYYREFETFILWEPQAAGTYLLRVAPEHEDATAHCDAYYDLRIDFAQIGLPLILGH